MGTITYGRHWDLVGELYAHYALVERCDVGDDSFVGLRLLESLQVLLGENDFSRGDECVF